MRRFGRGQRSCLKTRSHLCQSLCRKGMDRRVAGWKQEMRPRIAAQSTRCEKSMQYPIMLTFSLRVSIAW
jgi:hypothetical protein